MTLHEYCTSHTHSVTGENMEPESTLAQQPSGDNTGIQTTAPTASGQLALTDKYWTNNDPQMPGSDNWPSYYLPWRQWMWEWVFKIIDIVHDSSDRAIQKSMVRQSTHVRRRVGDTPEGYARLHSFFTIRAIPPPARPSARQPIAWRSLFNPACLVNPTGNFTVSFGSGAGPTGDSAPPGTGRSSTTIRTSARMGSRCAFASGSTGMPTGSRRNRSACRSAATRSTSGIARTGGSPAATPTRRRGQYPQYWWRVKLSDLANGLWRQQQLPTSRQPITPAVFAQQNGRRGSWNITLADEPRKRIFLVASEGVFVWQIPQDDSANGTWFGPFTPAGMTGTQWANAITQGAFSSGYGWPGCPGDAQLGPEHDFRALPITPARTVTHRAGPDHLEQLGVAMRHEQFAGWGMYDNVAVCLTCGHEHLIAKGEQVSDQPWLDWLAKHPGHENFIVPHRLRTALGESGGACAITPMRRLPMRRAPPTRSLWRALRPLPLARRAPIQRPVECVEQVSRRAGRRRHHGRVRHRPSRP